MADPVTCLEAVQRALDRFQVKPGSITHSLEQLKTAFSLEAQGYSVVLESHITDRFSLLENKVELAFGRMPDIIATKAGERLHVELKTGAKLGDTLNLPQLIEDAGLALKDDLRNLWKTSAVNFGFGPAAPPDFQKTLDGLVAGLRGEKLSQAQIERALASFRFEDALGNAIEFTWSKNGPIARMALHAASHSPDFGPAMGVLFGPDGKIAWAASTAAREANLKPALTGLEKQIESGVASAMDIAAAKAEAKAKEKAKKPVNEQVQAGFGALGKATKAIPELFESVTKLGDAWNKPLKSTKDYLDLVSAIGSTITQAGDAMEALAGLTKVATAAQAAFNFVASLNPITLIVIAVVALIAAIVLVVMYWDQVKLAFLKTANVISIGIQRIAQFFGGLREVAGQVWDWIAATATNLGIMLLNVFIRAGVGIENYFVGLINGLIEKYNVFASVLGLTVLQTLPMVESKTREIALREVPKVDFTGPFAKAFAQPVKGGLENQITATETVIAEKAKKAEAEKKAKEPAATPPTPAPAAPATPAPAGGDRSVTVNGGITVTINADRLEADSAKLLTDEIVAQLQRKLDALRSQQDFRTGTRTVMA